MKFRWDQTMPAEWSAGKPPSMWVYAVLFLVIECIALGITVATWPEGEPVASQKFVRYALAAPFIFWMALSFALYVSMYECFALEATIKNRERWHLITRWQRQSRAGIAVLDSVTLTPEPDLAERMLKLEGSPPENPGRVMALERVVAAEDVSRVRGMLDKLLTPLLGRLVQAVRSESFEIVMQCERGELSVDVQAVWEQLKLPGQPRIRWMDNDRDIGFTDSWFEDERHAPYSYSTFVIDRAPKYRLLLAWHLNEGGTEIPQTASESAVALLLGSAALMQEKPDLKHQAWLLRQIVADADQVDKSLALLLKAEQVAPGRIRHFWHSRLKGLAQHATLGAVKDTDLKVEEHALDLAVGPQAAVARWLLPALAAKMAHFGQGAQLVALPHEKGVALNLVVKESNPVDLPWKAEYHHNPFPFAELAGCICLWIFLILMSPNKEWDTFETTFTCVLAVVILLIIGGRILMQRVYADAVWREFLSYKKNR
jgi:hypothetical protein